MPLRDADQAARRRAGSHEEPLVPLVGRAPCVVPNLPQRGEPLPDVTVATAQHASANRFLVEVNERLGVRPGQIEDWRLRICGHGRPRPSRVHPSSRARCPRGDREATAGARDATRALDARRSVLHNPGVEEPAGLQHNAHWRLAVWSLRVGYLGLVIVVAGLVALLSGATPWVLAAGTFVWLGAAVATLTGVVAARRDLGEARPGLWPLRFMLLHDTVHALPPDARR
jgi:hypothetical protein